MTLEKMLLARAGSKSVLKSQEHDVYQTCARSSQQC